MDFLNALKERIPDYAKDIRLNLDATISRSSLDPADALGAALAAAFAARSKSIIDAIRGSGQLSDTDANGALTAAALMGMNTVWYWWRQMPEPLHDIGWCTLELNSPRNQRRSRWHAW